jgi:ABC-2 type transporter
VEVWDYWGCGLCVRFGTNRTCRATHRNPFLILLHFASTGAVALLVAFIFRNLPLVCRDGRTARRRNRDDDQVQFVCVQDWAGIQNRMGFMFFTTTFLVMSSLSSIGTCASPRSATLQHCNTAARICRVCAMCI